MIETQGRSGGEGGEVVSEELATRDRALVRAVAAWGDMRNAMKQTGSEGL